MDWGGGDKGGLIQGCKACCKPQESEQRRDEQEKVGTGRSCRARNLRNCRRPRASKAMNSRFCRCGFLWAVSSVAGGFVVSLISRYRLWAPGVGFSIIDTVEREGTWRSRLGTSTAKAIGPSASCSRTLARRTDHAQLLGSIHLDGPCQASIRTREAARKGGHRLSNQSYSQIFFQPGQQTRNQGSPGDALPVVLCMKCGHASYERTLEEKKKREKGGKEEGTGKESSRSSSAWASAS